MLRKSTHCEEVGSGKAIFSVQTNSLKERCWQDFWGTWNIISIIFASASHWQMDVDFLHQAYLQLSLEVYDMCDATASQL